MRPRCDTFPSDVFHGALPSSYDDPIVGPVLRRLARDEPELVLAIADVDRSLIWQAIDAPPRVLLRRAAGMARTVERLRRALG